MADPRNTGFWSLFRTADFPDLGPGPRAGVLGVPSLSRHLDDFFARTTLSAEQQIRLRATAYLYHDQHDPAHDLIQDFGDPDGALIHAILHRREPDYWNAKYWFRRVSDHPIYRQLASVALGLGLGGDVRPIAERLSVTGTLDPFVFVDACEEVAKAAPGDPRVGFLRGLQHAEFEALVAHLSS